MGIKQHTFKCQWIKKEITQQVRKYIGINENNNAAHPNFQDVIKSKFRKNIYMHIVEEKNSLNSII